MKILTVAFIILSNSSFAQYKMRPLQDLINTKNPAWVIVKGWINSAKNKVEILAVDSLNANDALYKTQVTTHSSMGAIVFSTGGLLIDGGWLRILGSGCIKMKRTLPDFNKGKGFKEFGDRLDFFLVADDAAGGYFAINFGLIGKKFDSVYYLSPDTLEWEDMDMNYEDFLLFCFNGDLKKFYTGIKWKSWKKDIESISPDEVFHILPPLWTKEGNDIEKSFRKPVPASEQFLYNLEMQKFLGIK
jgi:hypothetical protein